jgi:MFS family permease
LQGLGAAFIMPSAMSIVTNTFKEDQERNRAIGIFSSFAAIGSGSGLSLGGIISTYLSWHWVFLINVPILFITLIFAYQYLPKDEKGVSQKTDLLSGILLVLGLLSLTYGTHELVHIKEQTLLVAGSLILAVILLTSVVFRLKSVAQPLIDLKLLKHSSLVVSNLAFVALGAFFIGFLFLISLMLQKDMNHSAASAGLMLVPFSIMSALVAKFILPHVAKRLNSSQMGILGWIFMLSGVLALLVHLFRASFVNGFIRCSMHFRNRDDVLFYRFVCFGNSGCKSFLLRSGFESEFYKLFLGAGIGLSFMTLMSQIFPSELAVGNLSLIILIGYAVFALIMLCFFIFKNIKIAESEIAVS